MSIEQKQQKNVRFEGLRKGARKALLPAAIGAGILFPTTVYIDSALDESPQKRSEEISDFLNHRQTEIALGVFIAAGVGFTINATINARRFDDEKKYQALRVSGPVLLTAAAGTALLDAQSTINYAIPAGLALSSSYALAANTISDTLQRTYYKDRIFGSFVTGASLMAPGATIFLAAADKL